MLASPQKRTTVLTDAEIRSLTEGKTISESLGRGNGTLLFWRASGAIQSYYRYYKGNSPTLILMGRYREKKSTGGFSLLDCREKAHEWARLKRSIAPRDLKEYLHLQSEKLAAEQKEAIRKAEEEASRGTLADLLNSYIDQMRIDGKVSVNETWRSFQTNITKPLPHLLEKRAKDITPDDIVDILAPLADRGANVQMNRVRASLHAAFVYGAHADYDPTRRGHKRYYLTGNPVSLTRKDTSAENTIDRILSDEELQDLYLNVHKTYKVGIVLSSLVKMMVATAGQRPQALIRTLWKDYDFKRRCVSLVERKGKGGVRKHVIPLTARLIRVSRVLQAHNGDLPGPFYSSPDKEIRLDTLKNVFIRWHEDRVEKTRQAGLPEPEKFTARDIRRTANYLLTDAGVRPEDSNLLQSHGQTGIVKKHYDRHHHLPAKRAAIRLYEKELSRLLTLDSAVFLT
ncbi:MAG: tyrosine-type recombinase/integrase [Endozoicomonas sp.]